MTIALAEISIAPVPRTTLAKMFHQPDKDAAAEDDLGVGDRGLQHLAFRAHRAVKRRSRKHEDDQERHAHRERDGRAVPNESIGAVLSACT
jgi:hypothetical protein